MPIYEYQCQSKTCQHQWDELQSIKDEPLTQCPKCQQETAKKLISTSSFVLKGTGWFNSGGY